MEHTVYDEVVKLVDQLSPAEQQLLAEYLRQQMQAPQISLQAWKEALDSVKVSIPPGPNFSDRRAD